MATKGAKRKKQARRAAGIRRARPRPGSPRAVLDAMQREPIVPDDAVAELLAAIADGRARPDSTSPFEPGANDA